MAAWLTVVGVGEDGPEGLGAQARAAIDSAEVLVGGRRHLDLIPARPGQERRPWPSPFEDAYPLLDSLRGRAVCVLASGDPMLHGIGTRLAARFEASELRILPTVSSVALAAARLGWGLDTVTVASLTTHPPEIVLRLLAPGARLIVLSADATSPARLAALLAAQGWGPSVLHILEHLGGAAERRQSATARAWAAGAPEIAALNLIAIEARPERPGWPRGWVPGLPDESYATDGQLTKRDVRAVTLGRLAPWPGALLWDVGAGSGSIGIEWMRAHPACRAIAIESDPARQERIRANALALGVPGLTLVPGRAPEALAGLAPPDAIFIGGGLTNPGVAEACWQALKPGGRLVANAVTVQSEAALVGLRATIGGTLTRLSVAEATPLGAFDGWRAAMPVTILVADKPV